MPTEDPGLGDIVLAEVDTEDTERAYLDVGVLIFTNAPQPEDANNFGEWVFEEVRDNEKHLLPYRLREVLVQSMQWGAVRVLPEADPSVDLLISGTVLDSDGKTLALAIEATDSSGRLWLRKNYRDIAFDEDYLTPRSLRRLSTAELRQLEDPFADLYRQIANDLAQAQAQYSNAELAAVQDISLLVYANDLSPAAFGHMLRASDQGLLEVSSMPASDDPMLGRVLDMRRRHHLFIDTVDEYYEALHEEMDSPYMLWRRYSFDQIAEEQRAAERGADQSKYSSTSSFLTLTQRYDRFRWSKIYQREFQELAAGFNREVAPAILDLNRQVHGLNGTLEQQYRQWRRVLRELFILETGQSPEQ